MLGLMLGFKLLAWWRVFVVLGFLIHSVHLMREVWWGERSYSVTVFRTIFVACSLPEYISTVSCKSTFVAGLKRLIARVACCT